MFKVEQAAFNPANIVPGIGFSPDKMLQGRLFSYGDAQRYRLGRVGRFRLNRKFTQDTSLDVQVLEPQENLVNRISALLALQ